MSYSEKQLSLLVLVNFNHFYSTLLIDVNLSMTLSEKVNQKLLRAFNVKQLWRK